MVEHLQYTADTRRARKHMLGIFRQAFLLGNVYHEHEAERNSMKIVLLSEVGVA